MFLELCASVQLLERTKEIEIKPGMQTRSVRYELLLILLCVSFISRGNFP